MILTLKPLKIVGLRPLLGFKLRGGRKDFDTMWNVWNCTLLIRRRNSSGLQHGSRRGGFEEGSVPGFGLKTMLFAWQAEGSRVF